MVTAERVPPIPAALAHRPTIGGLVIPWVQVRLADGGADFRATHHTRWIQAWTRSLCQICGLRLSTPVVLLGGPAQLDAYFDEAPLHPWCAAYATKACPMLAGRLDRFADRQHLSEGRRGQRCPEPGCQCGGWTPNTTTGHAGEPAHPWWAVWARSWTLAATPEGKLLGGAPHGELRRRLVSTPGGGR